MPPAPTSAAVIGEPGDPFPSAHRNLPHGYGFRRQVGADGITALHHAGKEPVYGLAMIRRD